MNLATLVQSQTLATLLQALAPASGLAPGKTVEARLIALAGDGTATAQIGGDTIGLVLAGPAARQPALQPGATLVLRLEAPDQPGASLKATLVEVRPPTTTPAQPGAPIAAASPAATPPLAAPPVASAPAPTPAAPSAQPSVGQPAPTAASASLHPSLGPGAASQRPATAQPVGSPGVPATSGPVTPPATGAQTTTAAAASARALAGPSLGPALARQDSLAPLLANLNAVARGEISISLPKPILTLADMVLGQTLPVERKLLTAPALKAAIRNSGLFLEARQAQGLPATPGIDLKASLQALREGLAPLLQALSPGETARPMAAGAPLPGTPLTDAPLAGAPLPQDHAERPGRPAPPRRDGALIPQPIAEPTLSPGDKPLAIVETLLEQTDAALDRITLSQYASLPPEGPRAEAQAGQRWLTELPLAFQNGAAMLPLQIEKEPPRRDADGVAGPLWRVRFALDVEPMGPLQGVVTLQGRSVGITLWAEREATGKLLRKASPGLEAALIDARFEKGAIDIHTGQPRIPQPTAGQFLDRLS